jgi:hypothetical protein
LGVAGTITTTIGLLSLVVLAAFGVAQRQIKCDERIFRDAIATKDLAIVDAFLARFDIPKEKLGAKAAYDLATAQINAEWLKATIRYVLIFLVVLAFILLVYFETSPQTNTRGVALSEQIKADIEKYIDFDYLQNKETFDDTVDYYSMGRVPRQTAIDDQKKEMQRYPNRRFKLISPVTIASGDAPEHYSVTFAFEFTKEGPSVPPSRSRH